MFTTKDIATLAQQKSTIDIIFICTRTQRQNPELEQLVKRMYVIRYDKVPLPLELH
jgi:hypothetical protein